MKELRFVWDLKKARANLKKHGIAFEEARAVFYDEHAVEFYDDGHSQWEDRFLLQGLSAQLRLLLVCHCYREEDGVIRLVSARRATRAESEHYRRIRHESRIRPHKNEVPEESLRQAAQEADHSSFGSRSHRVFQAEVRRKRDSIPNAN